MAGAFDDSDQDTGLPDWLLPLLFAPFVGSFLGVVAIRWPEGRPIAVARSRCPHCDRALSPLELLPLVSWILAGGRCRRCKAALGLFYPAIELAALVLALWAASQTGGWLFWVSCLFGWALLLAAVIDLRAMILPDFITLPLIPLGLALAYGLEPGKLADHALGALAGFLVFAALRWGYRALRGREGLGFGDVKLAAAMGAWVSWSGLPSAILLGTLAALLWVAVAARRGAGLSADRKVPFGAFLAFGLWVVWLHGPILAVAPG